MFVRHDTTGLARASVLCEARPVRGRFRLDDLPGHADGNEAAAMTTQTVLIVDDDRSFVEALAAFLRENGYRPLLAFSGRAGLDLLKEGEADLAIIDVHMPDLNGVNLLTESGQLARRTPVIMISSDDSAETAERCRAGGANRFMAKPVPPDELLAAITQVFDKHS